MTNKTSLNFINSSDKITKFLINNQKPIFINNKSIKLK